MNVPDSSAPARPKDDSLPGSAQSDPPAKDVAITTSTSTSSSAVRPSSEPPSSTDGGKRKKKKVLRPRPRNTDASGSNVSKKSLSFRRKKALAKSSTTASTEDGTGLENAFVSETNVSETGAASLKKKMIRKKRQVPPKNGQKPRRKVPLKAPAPEATEILEEKEVAPSASVDRRRVYGTTSRGESEDAFDLEQAVVATPATVVDDSATAVAVALQHSNIDPVNTQVAAAADAGITSITADSTKSAPKALLQQQQQEQHQRHPSHIIHKVDRYGFILNMDSNGNIERALGDELEYDDEPIPSFAQAQRNQRRVKKWEQMMGSKFSKHLVNNYNNLGQNRRRSKAVLKRLRKGVPDLLRGRVWALLGDVPNKIARNKGVYDKLVRESIPLENPNVTSVIDSSMTTTIGTNVDASLSTPPTSSAHTRSFLNLQETIERDIHRTFPRHALFYETTASSSLSGVVSGNIEGLSLHSICSNIADDTTNNSDNDENDKNRGLCGTTEISDMIRELEFSNGGPASKNMISQAAIATATTATTPLTAPPSPATAAFRKKNSIILEGIGGQASLRRVLKAYSLYDREVGYCQGMNFITGMFLTLMSEEEAFWILVYVMQEEPCRMRGLFGEGMKETHQVLYVAEKLISHFLPRLAKHLDKENIHITMFATQWLLTQYTSSFHFDLVTRLWDCFLGEGWKVTYRVMLAILGLWQPTLLKLSFEEILAFFRDLPDHTDGGQLIDLAMKIPLRRQHIIKYEKEFKEQQR